MSDVESLEEQNIINLIEFYERELRLVLEGAPVDEVFKDSERKRLRGNGILGFRFPNWYVTDRAKEILTLIQ
jgi:hypothetical protein